MNKTYFRNMIFGAEDSLVSTVGVMFGIATATSNSSLIITSGLIVIAVEAVSMGAGAFLSESSAEEVYSKRKQDKPWISGAVMFVSYLLTGFITLFPYLFLEVEIAKYASVLVALLTLFLLGYLPIKSLKLGIKMVVVGGAAVLIGALVATISKL